jgi:hypothetical protein
VATNKTIEVLNAMQADGVIGRYAIAGAVAAYTYIESTVTEDLDVLVAFADTPDRKISGLVSLEPILAYLAERGYSEHRKEGIVIRFGSPCQHRSHRASDREWRHGHCSDPEAGIPGCDMPACR